MRLYSEREAMISQPILCKAFVGRTQELEHLLARRRAAAAGRGGLALVAGEPGLGKSRLLREFLERSTGSTVRVAASACREFAQRPLGPALEALAQLEPSAALAAGRAGASQSEHAEALIAAFAALGARRTTVIVLEDLHWADVDLLRTLSLLVERAARQRLLFVGTYRDNEIARESPLYASFGRLLRDPATTLVRLLPLTAREMNELLWGALGNRDALPARTLEEIRRRSDGNALFAEELLRHAVDAAAAGDDPRVVPLPHSLQAVVRERLSRCDEREREVLSRAALFGRRFYVDLLSEIFGDPLEGYRTALARLQELQLIDALQGDGMEYAFRHALTRDVVYGELLTSEAQPLHLRIAEAMSARADASRYVESLAHHFWEAGRLSRSAPYCEGAGEAAQAVHAYEDAAGWFERAARAYGEGTLDGARTLVGAAQALVLADAAERALPLYERAAAYFLEAGDFDQFVRSRAMAAGPLYDGAKPEASIALLEDTRAVAGERASQGVRDRLSVRLGLMYAFKHDLERARRCFEAIDAAALDPASGLAGEYYYLKARLHALRGERTQWHAAMEAGLQAYAAARPRSDDMRIALSNASLEALALGETALARAYQNRALEQARLLQSGLDYEGALLADVEIAAGELEAARARLGALVPPARFSGKIHYACARALLAALSGEDAPDAWVDAAMIESAAGGGRAASLVQLAGPFAFALDRAGRPGEARALLARACAAIDVVYDMNVTLAVTALLDPVLAGRVRPRVAAAAEPPEDLPNRALLALIDAAQARAGGEAAAAAHCGAEAAGRYDAIGWPWLAARAWELAGEPERALEIHRRIGAFGEVRRMERAGLSEAAAPKPRGVLTERERELALLVAGGKGNRAAAESLSITEKAVEKYLTSIYAKLGLSSRSQLAAYVAAGRGI
jgi:DNA-binding CsgD family transcriptional regulator